MAAQVPSESAGIPAVTPEETKGLKRTDLWLSLAVVGAVVAMLWRVVFTSDLLFFRDVFNYTYPHAALIQEICRQAQLPLWNPYSNYGQPILANPNFLFFYPYTIFIVLLPIDFAYSMHYVFHIAFAGVGTYWLARRWQQSRAAALFGALVFALSGPVLSLGNLYNHAACAAWIPWALLITDRGLETRSWRPCVLLTVVFGMQFLAAEHFTLFATFGLSVAYAFYRRGKLHPLNSPANRELALRFLLVGGFAIALSAVQLLPSISLLQNSRRGIEGLPFKESTYWSFHPLLLLEMVLPDFFGPPLEGTTTWTWVLNCRNRPYFPSVFVGFIPLFLALVGWASARDARRHFAAGSAGLLLLLSFGRFTPVFAWVYMLLPPLAMVRFPVKLLVPTLMLVALLAGWGLDALRSTRNPLPERKRYVTVFLQVLLFLAIVGWLLTWVAPDAVYYASAWVLQHTSRMFSDSPLALLSSGQIKDSANYLQTMLRLHLPGLAGFALGGILWVQMQARSHRWAHRVVPLVASVGIGQMVIVNYQANPTVPKTFYTYRPPVVDHFRDHGDPYRFVFMFRAPYPRPKAVMDQAFLNFDGLPEAARIPSVAHGSFRDRLLLARGTLLLRLEGASNDDVELSFPDFLRDFWLFSLQHMRNAERADCLLGRTNVKYMVARTPEVNNVTRELARVFNGSARPSYLYENLCAAPRVSLARRVSFSNDSLLTLTQMSAPDFDGALDAILAANTGQAPTIEEIPASPGTVHIAERTANQVRLQVETRSPTYVILRDRYDPNWHATVDGQPTAIYRANQLFRAVYIKAGKHDVRFSYHQAGLLPGAFISILTMVVLTIIHLVSPRESHPCPGESPARTDT